MLKQKNGFAFTWIKQNVELTFFLLLYCTRTKTIKYENECKRVHVADSRLKK